MIILFLVVMAVLVFWIPVLDIFNLFPKITKNDKFYIWSVCLAILITVALVLYSLIIK